jgi:hypothetical protein
MRCSPACMHVAHPMCHACHATYIAMVTITNHARTLTGRHHQSNMTPFVATTTTYIAALPHVCRVLATSTTRHASHPLPATHHYNNHTTVLMHSKQPMRAPPPPNPPTLPWLQHVASTPHYHQHFSRTIAPHNSMRYVATSTLSSTRHLAPRASITYMVMCSTIAPPHRDHTTVLPHRCA